MASRGPGCSCDVALEPGADARHAPPPSRCGGRARDATAACARGTGAPGDTRRRRRCLAAHVPTARGVLLIPFRSDVVSGPGVGAFWPCWARSDSADSAVPPGRRRCRPPGPRAGSRPDGGAARPPRRGRTPRAVKRRRPGRAAWRAPRPEGWPPRPGDPKQAVNRGDPSWSASERDDGAPRPERPGVRPRRARRQHSPAGARTRVTRGTQGHAAGRLSRRPPPVHQQTLPRHVRRRRAGEEHRRAHDVGVGAEAAHGCLALQCARQGLVRAHPRR